VKGANLQSSDLAGIEAQGADFSGSNLQKSDLTDANLAGANLAGANLAGANIKNVTWSNTTCPDGTNPGPRGLRKLRHPMFVQHWCRLNREALDAGTWSALCHTPPLLAKTVRSFEARRMD
jgi:hypothetical protein